MQEVLSETHSAVKTAAQEVTIISGTVWILKELLDTCDVVVFNVKESRSNHLRSTLFSWLDMLSFEDL